MTLRAGSVIVVDVERHPLDIARKEPAMNTSLALEDIRITAADPGRRPAAVTLDASVDAVRDALDHMDDDAVLSVPVATAHENFDVVEWCAANRKQVINRFDPWPLETLLVQNSSSDRSPDQSAESRSDPGQTSAPHGERVDDMPTTFIALANAMAAGRDQDSGRRGRHGFRGFRRNAGVDGARTLDQAWHSSDVASTRSRMSVGSF